MREERGRISGDRAASVGCEVGARCLQEGDMPGLPKGHAYQAQQLSAAQRSIAPSQQLLTRHSSGTRVRVAPSVSMAFRNLRIGRLAGTGIKMVI